MGAPPLKAGHSKGIEFLPDALGSVRDVVNDSGTVIQSYEFQEHGIPMAGSGASSGTFAPKTYQGGLSVNDDRNDSGLYLMGHRHWMPEHGRFISRDPIGFRGGLQLFTGAGTSPVSRVDPEGLESWIVDTQGNVQYFDSTQFGGFLKRWSQGEVERAIIGGHAAPTGIYPEVDSNNKSEVNYNYLFKRTDDIQVAYTDWVKVPGKLEVERGPTRRSTVAELGLVGKARIVELRGCRAGQGDENGNSLARQLSRELPGTRVDADQSYCGGPLERDGGPGLGDFWKGLKTGDLGQFLRGAKWNQPVKFQNGEKL